MNAANFFLLHRMRGFTGAGIRLSPAFVPQAARKLFSTLANESTRQQTISSIIYRLGHPSADIPQELDRWVSRGNSVHSLELRRLIHGLRNCRRYKHALEVSEWMEEKVVGSFTESDHAVHLNLIGEVHGISAAKKYFESLTDSDKNVKTYGALLSCSVKERKIHESLSQLQKMKEMGMASSPLPYNNIMCLYTNTGQHERVPSVLEEMKNNKVLPDNFSYRICINSLGTRSDIKGMEKLLEEMELQPQIVMDWNTYSVLANIYIKAGLNEKALYMLKKSEQKLEKNNGVCYNHLISLYCVLGRKQEIWRLWELQKVNCRKLVNRDYNCMLKALVKLQEMEEAETLLRDWESSGNCFDFRVPSTLIYAYRQEGLMEKAEKIMQGFLEKGKSLPSNSWGMIAADYAEIGELGKACEMMTNALRECGAHGKWSPNSSVMRCILQYLGNEGEVKVLENFVGVLKNAVPMSRDVYHALIKCNLRAGRHIAKILDNMKSEGIEPNEETHKLIAGFKS